VCQLWKAKASRHVATGSPKQQNARWTKNVVLSRRCEWERQVTLPGVSGGIAKVAAVAILHQARVQRSKVSQVEFCGLEAPK
jgi:hypothetical protein